MTLRFTLVAVTVASVIPAAAGAVERPAPPTARPAVFAAIVRVNPVPPSITLKDFIEALWPREVVIDVHTRPAQPPAGDSWIDLRMDACGVRTLSVRVSLARWIAVRLLWGERDPAEPASRIRLVRTCGGQPDAASR